MIIPILYMLYILAYAAVPFLYKSKRPAMLQFYLRMAWRRSFRRCYTLGMLATLMVFHFYHLNFFGNVHELALSSIACLALYSHKNTERAFDFLQRMGCSPPPECSMKLHSRSVSSTSTQVRHSWMVAVS